MNSLNPLSFRRFFRRFFRPGTLAAMLGAVLITPAALAASTPGSVNLTATINDIGTGTSVTHDCVVWVTGPEPSPGTAGPFIKTLWKQGADTFSTSSNDGDWDHFSSWNTARNGSTVLDGYTSATPKSTNSSGYTATIPSPPATNPPLASNPINVNWDCMNSTKSAVVPDGTYYFFIQYAESINSPLNGPVTSALKWTKGPTQNTPAKTDYPNQGNQSLAATSSFNFTGISVTWTPSTVAPIITSAAPAGGSQGTPYTHTYTATGSEPITYSVTAGSLPPPLTLSSAGVISGTPSTAGTYTGTVTAANGTLPNATQNFSITIAQAIVFTSAAPPGTGNVGTPYNHTCTASGGGTMTFAVASGALPTPLILSSTGVISGTPNATGTFTGTIKAHNGLAADVTQPFSIVIGPALVYTAGSVNLTATIAPLGGSEGPAHWSAVWVTKADGTFIKTVDIRGNHADFWNSTWLDDMPNWYTARAGSQALDGFTSATALTYNPPDSPLNVIWNCRDASNNLVPDGDYKFWVEYNEHYLTSQVTTSGLLWTKGASAATVHPANQGSNFTAMSIYWKPPVTSFQGWMINAVLPPGQSGPTQTPQNDGVTNLEKFAFNMDPTKPDVRMLTVGAGGTVGLPGQSMAGGKLRLEFLRRKAGTNPGITYTVQFGSDLAGWADIPVGTPAGTPIGTPADPIWERVTVDDPSGGTSRFGRVKIVQP